MNNSLISVVMSVYNTEESYLREAIESILAQTHTNFEFIIIDDYSNQVTKAILMSYSDPRIKILSNESNLGLTKSLNIGLKASKGKYIARMDSDDIALPNRFQEQLKYITVHPEYAVIGSYFYISNKGKKVFGKQILDPEIRRIHLLFFNEGICHPTAFFRKSFLDQHNLFYDEEIKKAQDYAMWVNIVNHRGQIGCIPIPLLTYRIHPNQITTNFSNQMSFEQMTMKKQILAFNHDFTEEELNLFYHFYRGEINSNEDELIFFLSKLVNLNLKIGLYENDKFKNEIFNLYIKSSLKQIIKIHRLSLLMSFKFLIKSLK